MITPRILDALVQAMADEGLDTSHLEDLDSASDSDQGPSSAGEDAEALQREIAETEAKLAQAKLAAKKIKSKKNKHRQSRSCSGGSRR